LNFVSSFGDLKSKIVNIHEDYKKKFGIVDKKDDKKKKKYTDLDKVEELMKQDLDKYNNLSLNEIISSWTEDHVETWLNEKNISKSIGDLIRPCDGKLLYEFYLMKKETPEYFTQSLPFFDSDNDFSMRDFALFSKELNRLFYKEI